MKNYGAPNVPYGESEWVLDGMTSVPRMFAAGDAITGTHGADRIGANMLAQCAIFGRTAGIESRWFCFETERIPLVDTNK